jgi:nitrate reductase delta subunit
VSRAADTAVVCQAAAVLLQYPDDESLRRWGLVGDALASVPAGGPRTLLERFLATAEATAPAELAESYVSVFDRKRRCCLYLTWWTDGETRRRGESLARLKERYRRGGLELAPGELPDFLPVALEYAATGDLADGLVLLQEHRAGIELLRLALRDVGAPWADVVEAVCELLPGASPQDRAAATALARTGPPTESVGLEPFGASLGPAPAQLRSLETAFEESGARR